MIPKQIAERVKGAVEILIDVSGGGGGDYSTVRTYMHVLNGMNSLYNASLVYIHYNCTVKVAVYVVTNKPQINN